MADRILRWFFEGSIYGIRNTVGGNYRMDADYYPTAVHLSCKTAPEGTRTIKVDILDDGVSIFDYKPALPNLLTQKTWTTIPREVIREGSFVTCSISQVANQNPGEDLTVEVELEKV